MSEIIARPREAIQARIADVDVHIDYGQFFGDQHDPHRAKLATESLWRKVTHGQTIKAEYSNPLGHKAVEDYKVPGTWAIGYTLEALQGNVSLSGQTVKESVRVDGYHRPIEKSSSLTITPIRKDGKRLVTERGQDGQKHQLFIHWVPEQQAKDWIEAERQYIKGNSK